MKAEEYEKMYRIEEANWWYKGRRELAVEILSGIKQGYKKLDVLDLGCGTGQNLISFQSSGDCRCHGMDISMEALRFCRSRENLSLARGSGEMLPFKSNAFDVVFALDVIEHIEDHKRAMKEICRILRPGGFLVLTVPAFQFLWSAHDTANHHKRRYTRAGLIRDLESSHLSVEKSTYWNFFLFPAVALFRLIRRSGEEASARTDLPDPPGVLNSLLLKMLRLEKAMILRGVTLPVGVSILCVCRNGGDHERG
ncbi:MAG TPA: class I SAM-dependent methyltransferase [Methanotrichaceae archaeon]|nr:class I SAM-dependent methyltransferase [Methanotrichaceae archaeon]